MGIESFLKVDEQDPDWTYSPTHYYGKKFKMIDANCLQIRENTEDLMTLRLSPTETDLLCKNLQVVAKDSSRLDLYIICDGGEQTQQVFLYNVLAEPNSILNIGVFVKDGKLNKHIFECEVYENAVVNIFGLSENNIGGSSEIIAKIFHAGPGAESNQFVNCTAGQNSRTVFQGFVRIIEDMVDSYAQVTSASIITDPSGQAFSTPQLSVDCGQAEVQHSCTVGNLDEEQLWFLQSRGLSEAQAKKLLVTAHQDSVLDLIQYKDIQDELKEFFRD